MAGGRDAGMALCVLEMETAAMTPELVQGTGTAEGDMLL